MIKKNVGRHQGFTVLQMLNGWEHVEKKEVFIRHKTA